MADLECCTCAETLDLVSPGETTESRRMVEFKLNRLHSRLAARTRIEDRTGTHKINTFAFDVTPSTRSNPAVRSRHLACRTGRWARRRRSALRSGAREGRAWRERIRENEARELKAGLRLRSHLQHGTQQAAGVKSVVVTAMPHLGWCLAAEKVVP